MSEDDGITLRELLERAIARLERARVELTAGSLTRSEEAGAAYYDQAAISAMKGANEAKEAASRLRDFADKEATLVRENTKTARLERMLTVLALSRGTRNDGGSFPLSNYLTDEEIAELQAYEKRPLPPERP